MRNEQWIIQFNTSDDTPTDANWVSKVSDELTRLPQTRSTESKRWETQSIYRIPWSMKELCSTAYRPQTVAIGPYHHGEAHLEPMEEHKRRALLTFLERSKRPLQSYVDALAPEVENLKDAYYQLEDKWKRDSNAFLQLMIVDGCFVLEVMRTTTATPEECRKMGYVDKDPVFSSHGNLCFVPYLKRDMLMLENQLPLVLLVKLLVDDHQVEDGFISIDGLSKKDQLSSLILKFLSQPHDVGNIQEFGSCLHILDLYRRSQLKPPPCQKTKPKKRIFDFLPGRRLHKDDVYIRSATELSEAGIKFALSKTKTLNDISFRRGVLRLPLVIVDDASESEYLNLMAYERFHADAGKDVTSFVFFMDSIIDSARDVSLLHSCGIVQNALGSDKAVANLFNSLSRDVSLDSNSSLGLVHKKVSDYCQLPVPRWMAYAKHNYLTNPWVGMSILAAVFLFALTGVQTAYTVLGYYHSK